jgi:hypothetical protein
MLQDALVYLLGKDILAFVALILYTVLLFGAINTATSYPDNRE